MAIKTPPLACSNCNLRSICMPVGMGVGERRRLDTLVKVRRKVAKGQTLFNAGLQFRSVFAVRSGVFKTILLHEDGREQVTGFHMSGDMIGMDGIVEDNHQCDAVALEDAEVCEIPFAQMGKIAHEIPLMQHHLHRIMSREIVRESMVMLLLGHAQADERLAAFFVNLGQRMHARGFSGTRMVLRMTRQELGSYLALTVETVSRTLTKFSRAGVLSVGGRDVHILDGNALQSAGKGQQLGATLLPLTSGRRAQAGQTDPCSGTTTRRCNSRSMR